MTACYAVNPVYLIWGFSGWTVFVPFWESHTGENFIRVYVDGKFGERARLNIVRSSSDRYPVGVNLLTVKQLRNSGYAHGSLSPEGVRLHRLLWAVFGRELRMARNAPPHVPGEDEPTSESVASDVPVKVHVLPGSRGPQYGGSALKRHH